MKSSALSSVRVISLTGTMLLRVSDLGVDDQVGDHSMFFQVGVSALSFSRLHLVWALQMLQRHWGDVDPPGDATGRDKWPDDERLRACAINSSIRQITYLPASYPHHPDIFPFQVCSLPPATNRWMERGLCFFSAVFFRCLSAGVRETDH